MIVRCTTILKWYWVIGDRTNLQLNYLILEFLISLLTHITEECPIKMRNTIKSSKD